MFWKRLSVMLMIVVLGSIASACVRGPIRGLAVYVSPTGLDRNNCWSALEACASIDRALSRVQNGGTVYFAAGRYELTSSITDLHGLTVVDFRGDTRSNSTLYSPAGGGEVLLIEMGRVRIYDLVFDGSRTPSGTLRGSRGLLIATGASVEVRRCVFLRLSRGIENNGGRLSVWESWFTNDSIGLLNYNDGVALTLINGSRFADNLYAIQHSPGLMVISGSTFLGNGADAPAGLLPGTIENSGRMRIMDSTFEGDLFFAIFNLNEGVLELIDIAISGGEGIGIQSYGKLEADRLTITGKPGGGFFNAHDPALGTSFDATLNHLEIRDNGNFGIRNQMYMYIVDSVIQGNDGDGFVNERGILSIYHSAIVGNHGRGIYAVAATNLVDSTVSGNDQEGIRMEESGNPIVLWFTTVVDNAGGGFWAPRPIVEVGNSIIALNPGGFGNCVGQAEWGFDGFNLACDVPLSMTELGLGPLTRVGETWVHPLLAGSPAVDSAIDVSPTQSCMPRDQAGSGRPQPIGGRCDIGAFELAGIAISLEITPIPSLPASPSPSPTPASAAWPVFTFTQQANCRKGPNTLYESVGFGQIGQQARIEGLSDPLGWYYVLLPDGLTRCFVAGSTGTVTGPVDGLSVILAPPLPVPPVVPAPSLPVPPAAPVLNVSNQVCDSKQYVVRLSWKGVDGEDGYRVYRDGKLVATLSAGTTSYDDTSPDYNAHAYRVEAYNDVGASGSSVMNSEGCVY